MNLFENKKYVLGTFVKVSDPALVEIAAYAGFDFVILDMEHGPNAVETLQNHVRAAEAKGIVSVIRIPELNESDISKALDIGARYVQVPQITNRAEAERVVRAAKFYPQGERGVCRFVKAANYSSMPKTDYFKNANNDTGTIIHLEGKEALAHFDEIAEVEGIDVLFLGPYDLSQSLGCPGQVDHPDVVNLMKEIVEKANKRGKIIGTFVESVNSAKTWIDLGVKYISYSVDVGIYYESCKQIVHEINNAWLNNK